MRWMLVAVAALAAVPSAAEEVTLRGVSAFALGTTFSRPFEAFVQWVNANGEGTIQIDLRGGPETMSPFEVGNAVSTGVVDIANNTSAFYTGLVPAGDALHLATNTIQDQRANGCFEQIDAIHREQMNVKYLARTGDHIAFHLYLTKRIDRPDLRGLTIRTTPVYRAHVRSARSDAGPHGAGGGLYRPRARRDRWLWMARPGRARPWLGRANEVPRRSGGSTRWT